VGGVALVLGVSYAPVGPGVGPSSSSGQSSRLPATAGFLFLLFLFFFFSRPGGRSARLQHRPAGICVGPDSSWVGGPLVVDAFIHRVRRPPSIRRGHLPARAPDRSPFGGFYLHRLLSTRERGEATPAFSPSRPFSLPPSVALALDYCRDLGRCLVSPLPCLLPLVHAPRGATCSASFAPCR